LLPLRASLQLPAALLPRAALPLRVSLSLRAASSMRASCPLFASLRLPAASRVAFPLRAALLLRAAPCAAQLIWSVSQMANWPTIRVKLQFSNRLRGEAACRQLSDKPWSLHRFPISPPRLGQKNPAP
jgi:hypothetical protein